tara:strand:- start:472 stop:1509 length:1038 start_codon:yes stop_codon:yes gene_type:complete
MARINMRGYSMSEGAFNEAERSVNYMINQKVSIREVLRLPEFKTSRRSIKKYLKMRGMTSKTVSQYDKEGRYLGRYLLIIPNIEQRMYQFMLYMSEGDSATNAAKRAYTTVKTMSKKEIDGVKIIKKDNGRWILNFYPIKDHSIVYFGRIIAFNDNLQGSGDLPEGLLGVTDDEQEQMEDGDIKSPDAAMIWWQIDFDHFISTLSSEIVGEFWKEPIMDTVRDALETHNIVGGDLSTSFLNYDKIAVDAFDKGRVDGGGSMKVSILEEVMQRYDVRLHPLVNYGVDDNHEFRPIKEWISIDKIKSGYELATEGRFQIMILNDIPIGYPLDGPIDIDFAYNLNEER